MCFAVTDDCNLLGNGESINNQDWFSSCNMYSGWVGERVAYETSSELWWMHGLEDMTLHSV
jgi:hypothetical protein